MVKSAKRSWLTLVRILLSSESISPNHCVDYVIINETKEDLLNQRKLWNFITEASGLKVNMDKTNIMICVRKQIPRMLLIKRAFICKTQPMSWPSARCECKTF